MNTIRVASYLLKINTGGEECLKYLLFSLIVICFNYFTIDPDGA